MKAAFMVLGAALILSACASTGHIQLIGQFAPDAELPAEIRVMLDPLYQQDGARGDDDALVPLPIDGGGTAVNPRFAAITPAAHGRFESERIPVDFHVWKSGRPPVPTYFFSFSNERDVTYAAGLLHGIIQYRTFDTATKQPVDRARVCWRVLSSQYFPRESRSGALFVVIAPNSDADKPCA